MGDAEECVGCLGTRRCWVCLGTGEIEHSRGHIATCNRCRGTGICTLCGAAAH